MKKTLKELYDEFDIPISKNVTIEGGGIIVTIFICFILYIIVMFVKSQF